MAIQHTVSRPFSIRQLRRPAAACALVLLSAAAAADQVPDIDDLQLEDLANIKVTSLSRRPELLSDAPASVFVITGDEIRRAGATTLPEALRLAPNLQVAQNDARNYAITARGFNNVFENKLLVLVDGRVVYSPLFSGVFWDAQDVMLDDVERIEVISGAGGTMWGANAVNGVINVITKRADQTQGTLLSAAGSAKQQNGALRYGATAAGGSYRLYAKTSHNDDLTRANGSPDDFGMRREQAGFRADWGSALEQSTLQGDAYRGWLHQAGTRDIRIGGANLLGRMMRQSAGGSELSLQAYWDYTERKQPGAFIEHLNTFDLQLQQARQLGIHRLLWGAGYRHAYDRVQNDAAFAFLPGDLNMVWSNLFLQDEVALADTLKLTGGIKLEHNSYTGAETLPTVRLAWKPAAGKLAWAAVSRAVRAPSRIDHDFYSPTHPALVSGVPRYVIGGGPDFDSETAKDIELGYRAQAGALSYSATWFLSRYDKLRTGQVDPDGVIRFHNGGNGRARGIEAWATWQALSNWRLSAGGTVQHIVTSYDPGVVDILSRSGLATSDPANHWLLRSSTDLGAGRELDLTLRHSGSLATPYVKAYTTMDLRYGLRLGRNLELSLVGQNLFDRKHPEFGAATEVERSFAAKLAWSY
ncbi:TonB-dependent receptor plug domain-containing protein [Massilia terrae]|uniref:TonB-dependent receptor n=1 Tax=Massilia terrae TaxID=1811224 RepID=A0ABT2CZB8_9BURK|nr:TonB-dependent receptor [Massilia terrae]MCS0659328.1 TonB-dependent receptor [Massilia terrae]